MNFAKTIFTAATLLTAVSTATLAAGDDKKFDGSYIGVETGLDWTKLAGDGKRDKSVYYGGVIGFRRQMDSGLVFGIEGTFGDTGYDNTVTGVNAKYEYSAGLTLGSVFGSDEANLIYGKAAYVRTRFDVSAATSSNYTDGGWRFGGGYERSLGDNISLRLGADYTTYGNSTNSWTGKAGLLVKF
jgi:Outer membrane protein beta-barrel domain